MSKVILRAQGICKSYRYEGGTLEVLRGVDVSVRLGESLAIVGKSGVGKSTLLHILGLLDEADRGRVELDGTDLSTLGHSARAKIRNRRFGFVFQFYHLLPELNALENVYLPAMIAAGTLGWVGERRGVVKRAWELLERIGLGDRVRHKPGQLSGGERQRVAIARALINEPEILFCDEPTGNLDAKTSASIIELLWSLQRERNQTLLVVTHDQSVARLTDRSLHMIDGRIVSHVPKEAAGGGLPAAVD